MSDPVDTAWRIHGALADWTGKVETKASFTLSIETALMVGIVTLYSSGRALSELEGPRSITAGVGVTLLAIAMLFAVGVVIPQLRSNQKLKEEAAAGNFIYFGHLRHLEPEAIGNLINNSEILPILAHQHRRMAEIAWTKHRCVQVSMVLAVLGVGLVSVAGLV
ncbi:hypothetical protein FOV72_19575 [Gordonia rubripertincta]|uniref:Pycsar system effector family protein n=1 Tax=Gordonia rubripertincta TaxID=36822 RepID=UPI00117D2DB9|nr:Pycsar system effector family protein [Gordonia rubripertincta]TSD93462.1 hypothetical protein FOV72_19575 [Gordonia rubripertincta]